MPKTKPPYPPEFRTEAVRLVRSSGRPIKEIASDLDVSEQTLRNWTFAAEVDAGEREGVTTDERAELRELRRRVRVLEQERDILKKAAAWFAKESTSSPSKGSGS